MDGLERFRALRTLTLQGIAKRNVDVAALEHLSALERLALDRPVSGLEAIGRLEQLTEFESPATASALSNLRGHPSLRKLILTRGTHRDLTALEACPQLTDVELWQIKQLTATLALQGAGFLVASRLQVDSSYRLFAVALVISGVGIGLIGSTGTTAITGSLGRAKQGVASAVNDTTREVGSAIGIALMGSVYASTYTDRLPTSVQALPPAAKTAVQESAAAGLEVARRLDTDRGDALAHAVRAAFVDGLSTSLLVIAAIIGVASVLVILRAPQRAERGTRANRARRPGPVVVSSDTKRVTVNALRAGIERPLASGRHRPSCETTT